MASALAHEVFANVIEEILGGQEFLQVIRNVVVAAADRTFEDKRIVRYPRAIAENMQMYVDLGLRDQFGQFGLIGESVNNQLRVISRHKKFKDPIRLRWCLGQRSNVDEIVLNAGKGRETYAGIAQNHRQWQLALFDRNKLLVAKPQFWNLWIIYKVTPRSTDVWVALAQKMPKNRLLRCVEIVELGHKGRGEGDAIGISDRNPPKDPDRLKKEIESSFSERQVG